MKAIVCTKYGPPEVLKLREVEKPIPKDNEVLIKVRAASVTTADCMMRRGQPFYGRLFIGLMRPKNPVTGTGFAGVVEDAGKEVTLFVKGDSVFGETGVSFGANAEYVCLPEDGLITTLPDNISWDEAAPICDGALTSWSFLKDIGQIQSGQKVLINGASGSLGCSAIQIAKYFGAEVTGVCSTSNVEMVTSLGADRVIDYNKEDFTKTGQTFDIIFDTIGKSTFSRCKDSLTKHGVYLCPVLGIPLLLQMIWSSTFSRKKAKFSATGLRPVPELRVLLNEIKMFIEAKELKLVIDRRYPLEQTAEAHKYVETGHKKGNVVISIGT
jgi:NADPH:quinone reductase-like Zn-dependent oxidoreductase